MDCTIITDHSFSARLMMPSVAARERAESYQPMAGLKLCQTRTSRLEREGETLRSMYKYCVRMALVFLLERASVVRKTIMFRKVVTSPPF